MTDDLQRPFTLTLVPTEVHRVLGALADKRFERRTYLDRLPTGREGHDPCCETVAARAAVYAEDRRILAGEVADLTDLIERFPVSALHSTGLFPEARTEEQDRERRKAVIVEVLEDDESQDLDLPALAERIEEALRSAGWRTP